MAFDPSKVDLSSLSQVTEDENIEDTNLGGDDLDFTMSEAMKVNPEQHAKVLDLSKQTGIPTIGVESDIEGVEREVKRSQYDFSGLRERSPNTAGYLSNIDNAIVAQDDVDVLAEIEDVLKATSPIAIDKGRSAAAGATPGSAKEEALRKLGEAEVPRTVTAPRDYLQGVTVGPDGNFTVDILSAIKEGSKPGTKVQIPTEETTPLPESDIGRLQTAASQFIRGGASVVTSIPKTLSVEASAAFKDVIRSTPDGDALLMSAERGDPIAAMALQEFNRAYDPRNTRGYQFAESMDKFIEDTFQVNPEYAEEFIAGKIPQGLGSAVGFMSTLALTRGAGVLGGAGAGYAANAQSQFEDALDNGASIDDAVKSSRLAGVMGMSEILPISNLLNRLDKGTGGSIRRAISEALKQGSEEAIQETMQTIWSNLIASDIVEYDPERQMLTGTGEAAGTGFSVGALMATLGYMVTGGRRTPGRTQNFTDEAISQGEIEQNQLDRLNTQAEKSTLRKRNKESFRQFVEQSDGENNTHVFIDGAQVSLYLQDKTQEEVDADPALKLLADQAREAAALGVDVQIPVADFTTDIAGTEHFTALRESMTMSDESIAPFRQEQAKQETESYIQTLIDEAQESASEYVEAQEIYTSVRDQLIDTGTVNAQNASVMAQIVPAWATAQARRQGKTVQQVYQEAGLVIEGPQTGERARLEGEQVLEQPAYEDAPLIFDRVRDEFLNVVPEDATVEEVMEVVDQFTSEQRNFVNALNRDDWLGFDFPSQAINQILSEGGFEGFEVSQGLKQSIGRLVNVPQRATLLEQPRVPTDEGIEVEEITDAEEQRRLYEEFAALRLGGLQAGEKPYRTVGGRDAERGWSEATRILRNGNPAVVYRGSRSGLDSSKFEKDSLGQNTKNPQSGLGVFFSSHESEARRYGPVVEQFHLDIRKFKRFTEDKDSPAFGSIDEAYTYREQLKKEGYDGIIFDYRAVKGPVNFVIFDPEQAIHPQKEEELFEQAQPEKDLFVAHNLSAENILAAEDLGGLAAPSIAVARADISDFTGFGEVTLLADPSLLEDPKARTFDADIYSPRQPRATYDIDQDVYSELYQQLDKNLNRPDINSLEDTTGADNLLRSDAVEYHWLQQQGKAPKLKKKKVEPYIRKLLKLDIADVPSMVDDEKFIKIVSDHYRGQVKKLEEMDPTRAEKYDDFWFNDDGTIMRSKLYDVASEVRRYQYTGGMDYHQLSSDIGKKMRVKKNRTEYEQWVHEQFNNMVTGKTLFKGFTPSGNRKYVDYNMQNVVKEMTRELQAGESTFYGAGTVRSKYANEMKTIKQIQAKRDEIVSEEDMTKIKEESSDVFMEALDALKPFYKYDADSWGYGDDAGNAIIEGRRGLNEAFNMTPEAQKIVDDLLEYLTALPTSYFEAKIQRAVQFSEFDTAVVPRGMRKDALQVLKDAGLKIKTYDPNKEGARAEMIAKQRQLLFQENKTKQARGYYDPANSVIRLTEAADLSTFLHEFAHFMYEMEVNGDTEMLQSINGWYKRNAKDVAREANSYLGDKYDALKQEEVEQPTELKDEGDIELVETGKSVTFNFIHNTESATGSFGLPREDDPFGRNFEPSGRYVVVASEKRAEEIAAEESNLISGKLTLRNPLVVFGRGTTWKRELSEQYDNKVGKELSKAVIADGYDGIITYEATHISEIVEFTTFDEAKALFQPPEPPTAKEGSITEADVVAYLDNKTTGDKDKDSAIRRAVHEQFARGFETYLMEGKAPSIELRNAFRTFARWLARIYQNLRGQLDVELDEEMRQVFDRLLATEEQIAAAESRAMVEPMFTDAAMAGMTDDEFAAYQKRQEKVKDVQSETLRDKLIKQLTRQTKAWWKEEKSDLIDEEIESLKTERVYAARERLRAVTPTEPFDKAIEGLDKEIAELDKRLAEIIKKNDTVGQFISKKGGLNRESFEREGVDPQHFKDKAKVFGKPLFPKQGGMTADDLAEVLNERGYQGGNLTANDAVDVVFDMLSDDTTFINMEATAEAQSISSAIDSIEQDKEEVERQADQINLKLDHAAVKEMVGVEKTDKRGVTSTVIPPALVGTTVKGGTGVHPDEAAAFFGYRSGSEMLNDLATAPPIKEAAEVNAEARMIERHGDILTDGTIEREADEAVQNEERGKLILQELKALSKGTKVPATDRSTIKMIAEERIGRLSFREIHPGKYRRAEVRAAQEAARMLAEGNKQGAADAKMRQVMNYYLGMAATNAKNETTKILDRMARYNKKKVREEIMKAENGYWDQIVKILSRFEFRKSASLEGVESLNTWMKERMESDGDGLVLSNAVLNESYVTHWKNVPFSDLQGINDSVKNIEHVARYANKMTMMQEEIDFKKLKSDWVDHINQQDQRFPTKESRSRIDDARKASTMEHVRRWASQLTKVPYLASWLDGGERVGMSHQILIQQLTDALDAKMKLVDEVATPVLKLISSRSKEDKVRHNQKVYIPEIDDHLQGHQILAVALNVGNAGNLKKLLLGEGWANPDNDAEITIDNPKLQAVLSHMSRSDWELVQQIWDQMELLYPQLADVHRRTTGLTPPKVESTPVVTPYGTFRGGYYPVKYSPRRSHKAEKNAEKREAETESMFNNTASIQASVNAGATNERTGFYDRIFLSLDVIPDHFNETIHYITHHDAVRQINRLIQAPEVANAISGVLGEEEFKQLKPWLNDVAKDGRQQPVKTFIDEAFQRLRFGTTLGVMGFKASTGIMQLFGMLTTAAELGVGPTFKGVQTVVGRSFYMKAARKLLGSTDDLQSGWDFAAERSKVMSHRAQTMDREIRNAMNRLSGKVGILPAVQEVSMKHIALIQTYMVDLPTWHAAYDKHIAETNDEDAAVRFADAAVENLQGSGATKDMATMMRNQSKIHTTFTMFMTFFSSLGNLSRDLVKGTRQKWYSPTSAAAKVAFLFTLPVFFEMLMRGEFDDEDDDERLNKFLVNAALYPLTSVPFVRDVASGALSGFGYNATPVAAVIENGIAGAKGAVENLLTDEEVTASQAKRATKLAGAAAGIPGMNQMWASGEHLYDVIEEGEEFTVRELLFGPDRD